ncbi:MAG: ABC transporter substrate-binding protein [Athalassotoga sp.]|uniref:ABC transporter substrate-binding protein n=2 Tax=Athalassotoga sp. TaxID=2022597 RepID=UPI003D050761
MKKFFVFSVILGLFLTFAFAADSSSFGVYPDKVVIGTFQALSGPYAIIGQGMLKGMKAYFNWINDQGGINGRKIDLLVYDDQLNPALTVTDVKRMVEQDHVFAVVGGLGTPGCLAVMGYLNDNGVPFVYQGSGAPQLSNPPKEYVFPVQPNYDLEGHLIARFLVQNEHKSKIAVMYMNNDIGQQELDGIQKQLADFNMKPYITIAYNPSSADFSSDIIKLMSANPDSLVIAGLITDTIRIVTQIKQYGMNIPIVTIYPNADPAFIQLGGKAVEGVILTGWVPIPTKDNPDFTAKFDQYLKIYQKSYPNEIPSSYAAAGFIAAEVFSHALELAGPNPTRDGLVNALDTFDNWNGILSQDITFTPTDREGKTSMYFMKIENGTFVPISGWITLK